jgi:hypothetical protein
MAVKLAKSLVRPRFSYDDIYNKPIAEQVRLLSEVLQDIYYQMQGVPVNGLAITSDTFGTDDFAFMMMDP